MLSEIPSARSRATVLVGLENAGKSALFRGLTGQATGTEANIRGSTVVCRRAGLPGERGELVDTPGVRVAGDSVATRMALSVLDRGATVALVVRGTHVRQELPALLNALGSRLVGKRVGLVLTFGDRLPAGM